MTYEKSTRMGTYPTNGRRFLCDVFNDHYFGLVYCERLYSVAADNNNMTVDSKFFKRLVVGREYEVYVKEYLLRQGFEVESTEFVANTAGEPDLVVNGIYIVEVKAYGGEQYRFNHPNEYPYPAVFTNNAEQTREKYELAKSLGGELFYIICSQVTGAMVGFRYHPSFFWTNNDDKTCGKREHLLPIERLIPYLSKTNNPQKLQALRVNQLTQTQHSNHY